MEWKDHKVKSIIKGYHHALKKHYDAMEIDNFIYYLFHFYHNYSRINLLENKEEEIEEMSVQRFSKALEQLKKFTPIQYIIGETEFYNLKIKVNKQVLIPRQETEELVQWITKEEGNALSILDIGTGSACIAIALKKNMQETKVMAIDVSEEALILARENALLNKVSILFEQKDILKEGLSAKYDVIVSNPPYVLRSEMEQMQKNVLDYEPHLALFVEDDDPLLFYKRIADLGKIHLNSGGKLYFEINEAYGKALSDLLKEKGYKDIDLHKDISGKDRMLRCVYQL